MNSTNNVVTVAEQSGQTINTIMLDLLRSAQGVGSEIYTASKAALSQSVDFVMKEFPQLVQEFIRWKFFESAVDVGVSLVLLILLVVGSIYVSKLIRSASAENMNPNCPKKSYLENPFFYFGHLPLLALGLAAGITLGKDIYTNSKELIKIKVAPRVYLMEWTAEQIKNQKR